jgi:methionyl-tRNA synthetase
VKSLFLPFLPSWTHPSNALRFLADRFVEGTCPHCAYQDARGDQCDSCSRVLDPMDLINPRCHVSISHKVTTRPSWHMYIKLDAVQSKLETWIQNSWKAGYWSQNPVVNSAGHIVDPRFKAGLKPSSITRDLKWGVKVPDVDDDMKGKVLCEFDI